MSFKMLSISTAVMLALSGCGSSDEVSAPENPEQLVVVPPVVVDYPSLTLEEVTQHISTSEPLMYVLNLPEDAQTLVINLFSGIEGQES